jgi:hypothetical protein
MTDQTVNLDAREPAGRAVRRRLPHRRASSSFDFRHDGVAFHVHVGFFPDGQLGEVFIDGHKVGSALDAVASDAAVLTSLLLQLSVDPREIAHSLRKNSRGEPATAIGRALDILIAENYPTNSASAASPAGERP